MGQKENRDIRVNVHQFIFYPKNYHWKNCLRAGCHSAILGTRIPAVLGFESHSGNGSFLFIAFHGMLQTLQAYASAALYSPETLFFCF
jgi:hypothetical protein